MRTRRSRGRTRTRTETVLRSGHRCRVPISSRGHDLGKVADIMRALPGAHGGILELVGQLVHDHAHHLHESERALGTQRNALRWPEFTCADSLL